MLQFWHGQQLPGVPSPLSHCGMLCQHSTALSLDVAVASLLHQLHIVLSLHAVPLNLQFTGLDSLIVLLSQLRDVCRWLVSRHPLFARTWFGVHYVTPLPSDLVPHSYVLRQTCLGWQFDLPPRLSCVYLQHV